MPSGRTILRNLKCLQNFLNSYPANQQPANFEKIVSEAFAHVFHKPFYCSNDENTAEPFRVTWQGDSNINTKAPAGGPDTIAYCHDYYLTIESTLSVTAAQCGREFTQSLRHCEDFCVNNELQQQDVYSILVCKNLHRDTYRAINAHPQEDYRVVPLKVSQLSTILQTSILAFTLKHLEIRKLINRILDLIKESTSLDDFNQLTDSYIVDWQKQVLKFELGNFLGINAYKAIKEIGRNSVSSGEVYNKLIRNPVIGQYYNLMINKMDVGHIEKYLIEKGFACCIGKIQQSNEMIFELVSSIDYKDSNRRLMDAIN